MNIEDRDLLIKRLEDLAATDRNDPIKFGMALCEIWKDNLWELSDDSFEEFLENEYEMPEIEAFLLMKGAAATGCFPVEVIDQIEEAFEKL